MLFRSTANNTAYNISFPRSWYGTCLEIDVEYHGNNIDITNQKASTPDCQRLCQSNPKCKYFTFITNNKKCWLKSSNTGWRKTAGSISGQKYCAYKSSTGNE